MQKQFGANKRLPGFLAKLRGGAASSAVKKVTGMLNAQENKAAPEETEYQNKSVFKSLLHADNAEEKKEVDEKLEEDNDGKADSGSDKNDGSDNDEDDDSDSDEAIMTKDKKIG